LHDYDDQVYDNNTGQSASLFNKGGLTSASISTNTCASTGTNTKSKINSNEAYNGSNTDVEVGGGGVFLFEETR
jgi:hypothetical protein